MLMNLVAYVVILCSMCMYEFVILLCVDEILMCVFIQSNAVWLVIFRKQIVEISIVDEIDLGGFASNM